MGPGGGRFGPELPGAAKGPGTTSGDFSNNQDFLGWGLNDASIMVGIYICIYIYRKNIIYIYKIVYTLIDDGMVMA